MIRSSSGAIHVLHVDDEPAFAELAAEFLSRHADRIDVETATSAAEALDRMQENEFDCLVSDFDMPGQDGIELLEAVREEHPDLPFILYTGEGSEEVASDAISAGVTDYLRKQPGTDQFAILANKIVRLVQQQRTETALRQEYRQRTALFNQFPEPTLAIEVVEGTPIVRAINRAFETTFGFDEASATGQSVNDLIVPVERQSQAEQIDERTRGGDPIDREIRRETEHGQRDFRLRSIPVDGNIDYYGVYEDITEQKQRERALTALHTVAVDLDELDTPRDVCERTIAASEEILEFDKCAIDLEEDGYLTPVALSEDIPTDDPTRMSVQEGITGKTFRTGASMVIDDIQACDEAQPQGPYHSAISVPIGDHGIFQAVSETPGSFDESDLALTELLVSHTHSALARLDRERQLERQNERLDEFASVVSHDLRNPINVAQGRIDLAREECEDAHIEAAERALDRMEALIDDMLQLAREGEQVGDLETVALADIVEDCWTNVENEAATLVVDTERQIRADPSRVQQLLENLLRNAVEHGGSTVTITVGDHRNGYYVEDDGPGILQADRKQIFEAGYSTGEQGTGFGLAIVQTIADAHGWTVDVTSSKTGGARFEFSDVLTVESD